MRKSTNFINYKKIPLFYWSEKKFIFRDRENYGDLLSKYLVEKISGKRTSFVHPRKQAWYKIDKASLLAIGSIIHHASKDSIVWGSGIIDHEQFVEKADFKAVRGPRTRQYLMELGYDCPETYGDPAILLPVYYRPQVEKKYRFGIVPHYHDYHKAIKIFAGREDVKVVDLLTLDVEATTREILECEKILSTSLHGLIVAQAYGIPAVRVKMSDKLFGNDIKYTDYLEAVGLENYVPVFIDKTPSEAEIEKMLTEYPVLPKEEKMAELQKKLLKACPL